MMNISLPLGLYPFGTLKFCMLCKQSTVSFFYAFVGLKSVIALICIGAAVVQCVELLINFQTHATMWTKDTKLELEDMPTPSIIFCTEPPNLDPDHEIVYQPPDIIQLTDKHSIVKFKTVLKVGIHILYCIEYNNGRVRS